MTAPNRDSEGDAMQDRHEHPGHPTDMERMWSLARAAGRIEQAAVGVSFARHAVVPSGVRSVLGSRENYDYQVAISEAEKHLTLAGEILRIEIEKAKPLRCQWPGGHLGPIAHVEPFEHVQRCAACGEEWGKRRNERPTARPADADDPRYQDRLWDGTA